MRTRAQCIVYRENKVLMVKLKHRQDGHEYWVLPGGRTEDIETPAEAAIRELKEECCINGTILSETGVIIHSPNTRTHTFIVDIGAQEPKTGSDPEHQSAVHLLEVKWLTLSEIPERDRVYLWAAGLSSIERFWDEVLSWGDSISYPQQES